MLPTIKDGDILTIQPIKNNRIRVGDVVLCSARGERAVVHRVVAKHSAKRGFMYLIKGDHVRSPDGWLAGSHIFGSLIKLERDGLAINMKSPRFILHQSIALLRSKWHLYKSGQKTFDKIHYNDH